MKKKSTITKDDFYAICFVTMLFIAFVVVSVCCFIPAKPEKDFTAGAMVTDYACTQDYAEWLKYRIRYDVFKQKKPFESLGFVYEY